MLQFPPKNYISCGKWGLIPPDYVTDIRGILSQFSRYWSLQQAFDSHWLDECANSVPALFDHWPTLRCLRLVRIQQEVTQLLSLVHDTPQGLSIMAAKQKADRLNPTLSITPSKPSVSSGSLFTQVNCKIFIYHWGRSNFHQDHYLPRTGRVHGERAGTVFLSPVCILIVCISPACQQVSSAFLLTYPVCLSVRAVFLPPAWLWLTVCLLSCLLLVCRQPT